MLSNHYSTSELITLFDPHHSLQCEIESKVINFFKANVLKHISGHELDYRLTLDAEDLCFEVYLNSISRRQQNVWLLPFEVWNSNDVDVWIECFK